MLNKKETKILFITNSGSIGGAGQCLLDLILNSPKWIRPLVIIPREGRFLEIIKDHKIDYYVMPIRGWWYSKFRIKLIERAINNIRAIVLIYFAVKKLNIKLVYTNTLYSPVGAIIARILKVPHIWHAHEFTHLNFIQKFDYGLKHSMKFVNQYSDVIICPSISLKMDISNYIQTSKIRFVYNGIAINKSSDKVFNHEKIFSNDQEFKILIIGSIIEFKGQIDAILAIKELLTVGKNVRLIIVGDGELNYVNNLHNLADEMGISSYITWEGYRDNINDYINNSNLLYVCSKYETFGMVIIEAMSKGCPVIATKTGGISEIIKDGYNGFLYECGNIKSLTEKTELLMNNKELYSMISKNSNSTSLNQFPMSKYINGIYKIIEETLDIKSGHTKSTNTHKNII